MIEHRPTNTPRKMTISVSMDEGQEYFFFNLAMASNMERIRD